MKAILRLLFLFSLVALIGPNWTTTPAAQSPANRRVTLPATHQINASSWQSIGISSDGARLVYAANGRLFTRPASTSGEASEIVGSAVPQGVTMPVFSPDGRSVAFWSAADQTLRRIPVTGGVSSAITKADNPQGMIWTEDDQIVFGQGPKGILKVAAAGGTPEVFVASAGDVLVAPRLLPGNALMFTAVTQMPGMPPRGQIMVQAAGSSARRLIVDALAEAHFVPSGHLVYTVDGELVAHRFDVARLSVVGQRVRLNQDVRSFNVAQMAVSPNGTLVSIPGRRGHFDLAFVDRTGRRDNIGTVSDSVFAPRVSPDGKRITIDDQGGIWVGELANLSALRQIIPGGPATGLNQFPQWDETGNRVFFISTRDGGVQSLFSQAADGSGQAELLARPARSPETWSPENGFLTYISLKGASDYDIWRYSLRDKTNAPLIEVADTAQLSSRFSHDGKWIAYMANDSGQFEIYVQAVNDPSTRTQITSTGAKIPVWSNDDREIFFTDVTGTRFYSAPIQVVGNRVTAGAPVLLPISGFIQRGTIYARRQYDLMPDGRFLMMFPPPLELEIASNWADELGRRLP